MIPEPLLAPESRLQSGAALALATSAFVIGVLLAGVLGGVAVLVSGSVDSPLTMAAGFVGLWIPMVGAGVMASRRFGSGSVGRDLGFRLAFPVDLGLALVVALCGMVASGLVQFALSPFPRLLGSNTGFIADQRGTIAGVVVVVGSTLVGAPLVEELFFRGLVLRALLPKLGWAAVVIQAVVFGLIHFDPTEGLGNVGVIAGVGVFGLVQGIAAWRLGRIGPTILSHALFNAVAVVPVLLGH
ncbi:MAG: protease family protein [Actinomycetota bacterium]|nr:protease family protein [Actinomycetota bacterium]